MLIEQIAIALGLGLAGGIAARLAGLSPIVGYLAAGVLISPFTPGYSADIETLQQLADLGIIFLMFGVGLHFNLRDLARVWRIAVPGAILQMLLVGAVGYGAGETFGLAWREGVVIGAALAISSTVVVVRALEDRGLLLSVHGRVAIGWLVVQDLATIFILAILPALNVEEGGSFWEEAGKDIAKEAAFLILVLTLGARLMPRLLGFVARTGSRELFILSVVAMALAVAAGSAALGLSVALGAFVAGIVVSEDETSHQAAADVLPFREAFAVLFFVAVGMLLDPEALGDVAGLVAAMVVIVVVVKGLLSVAIAAAFPYPVRTALLTGAGLAQVGEFSFVIANTALREEIIDMDVYNALLATAVITITLNPLVFGGIPFWEGVFRRLGPVWRWAEREGPVPDYGPPLTGHVIVAGYGRVGELTGHALAQLQVPFVVVESDINLARQVREAGQSVIWGDAASQEVLTLAGVEHAKLVVVAVPDETTALLLVANVRRRNPAVPIVVRARTSADIPVLKDLGAAEVVVPEYEGGLELMRQSLVWLGYDSEEALHFSHAVRDIHYNAPEHH